MIVTRRYVDDVWIDLSSPTEEEVNSLVLTNGVDLNFAKDLLLPTPKQQSRESSDSIYAVLHIPVFIHSRLENMEQEVDCIIKKSELITCRYDSVDALHYFAKQIEVNEILNKSSFSHPFFGLMREVYKFINDELSYMEGWLRDIDQSIFKGREKEMVFTISTVSRTLLSFHRTINPHKAVLEEIKDFAGDKWGDEFSHEAKLLIGEWNRVMLALENLRKIADELRETNNSLVSTKQNEIMKVLTIMAFVTFPLSLIASIFGMNTSYIPIVGSSNDFWIVMGIMGSATLMMFSFFRYKKWL